VRLAFPYLQWMCGAKLWRTLRIPPIHLAMHSYSIPIYLVKLGPISCQSFQFSAVVNRRTTKNCIAQRFVALPVGTASQSQSNETLTFPTFAKTEINMWQITIILRYTYIHTYIHAYIQIHTATKIVRTNLRRIVFYAVACRQVDVLQRLKWPL